jgi:hypothetical protein
MENIHDHYEARQYFNEFIDIMFIHNNNRNAVGQFAMLVESNKEEDGNFIKPIEDIIYNFKSFSKTNWIITLYVLCYLGESIEDYEFTFSERSFMEMYMRIINNEYGKGGRDMNHEILADFADNFKNLFIALFGKEPNNGILDIFEDITGVHVSPSQKVSGDMESGIIKRGYDADEDEDTYGGNIPKNRFKNNSGSGRRKKIIKKTKKTKKTKKQKNKNSKTKKNIRCYK